MYSAFLTNNVAIANAERALVTAMDAPKADAHALAEADRAMVAALDRLRKDAFAVSLVGSRRTSAAADALMGVHSEYGLRAHGLIRKIAAQPGQNLSVGHGADYNDRVIPLLSKHLAAFMAAARADLGLPDTPS